MFIKPYLPKLVPHSSNVAHPLLTSSRNLTLSVPSPVSIRLPSPCQEVFYPMEILSCLSFFSRFASYYASGVYTQFLSSICSEASPLIIEPVSLLLSGFYGLIPLKCSFPILNNSWSHLVQGLTANFPIENLQSRFNVQFLSEVSTRLHSFISLIF